MSSFLLGLTGSIGMGKSTTAAMFASFGVPVWDADSTVHRLYAKGGRAVAPLAQLFPDIIVDHAVSRAALKSRIAADSSVLGTVESVVHPLVTADRATFILAQTAPLVVLDIPLLFETSAEAAFNATLLVTAPAGLQRDRVLKRPGMTVQQFESILARQMPDAEKRRRATHIVETLDIPSTQAYVIALIAHIRGRDA
jgi:dephospho-CoA kinase